MLRPHPTPSLAGRDGAHLLRILAIARERELPLLPAVAATADLRGAPQAQRFARLTVAGNDVELIGMMKAALERGIDAIAARVLTALERASLPAQGLRRLAEWLSQRAASRHNYYRAVSYPFILMITGSLVYAIAFHLLLIPLLVKEFHGLLAELGVEIPLLIRLLAFLYQVPWLMWSSPIPAVLYVICVLALCGLCLRWLLRFSEYRISLYLPFLREYLRLDAAASFCDTLAMLLGAHVPLPEAVRLSASSVPSGPLRHRLEAVADRVERGEGLGECLRDARVFPPAVAWRLWSAYYGDEFQAELTATAISCRHGLRPWEVRIQQSAKVVAGAGVAVVLSPVALAIFALNDCIYAIIQHIG